MDVHHSSCNEAAVLGAVRRTLEAAALFILEADLLAQFVFYPVGCALFIGYLDFGLCEKSAIDLTTPTTVAALPFILGCHCSIRPSLALSP